MSNTTYQELFLYVAGYKIPYVSCNIESGFNSLAVARVVVDYSPHILNIQKNTKITIFSKEDGYEEELEFDGILIGVVRNKNVLGRISVELICMTDGAIWNQRKQLDYKFDDFLDRGTIGDVSVELMSLDSSLGNRINSLVKANAYDVGCTGACNLTSSFHFKDSKLSYEFVYNGKTIRFTDPSATQGGNVQTENFLNPKYYKRFLYDFSLRHKMYGTSTVNLIKKFFNIEDYYTLLNNQGPDIYGENTFWQIASNFWNLGMHEVYDIPNPTFIKRNKAIPNKPIDVATQKNADNLQVTTNREFHGLAEYVVKPRSIFNVPTKCNVIFPEQVLEEIMYTNYFGTPSRVRYISRNDPMINPGGQNMFNSIYVGPNFQDNAYFKSYNHDVVEHTVRDKTKRTETEFSEYEKVYGVNTQSIFLQPALDASLVSEKDTRAVLPRINSYLNLQFGESFYGARNYTLAFTSSTKITPGMTAVILSETGQHILAYCNKTNKNWNAQGSLNFSASLTHPRYIDEFASQINDELDPLANPDGNEIKELAMLYGTELITKGIQTSSTTSIGKVKDAINYIFTRYVTSTNKEEFRKQYKRNVCTYSQFAAFHNQKNVVYRETETISQIVPGETLPDSILTKFNSTDAENKLSTNRYSYYDTIEGKMITEKGLSSQTIVKKHLEFIKRIANMV